MKFMKKLRSKYIANGVFIRYDKDENNIYNLRYII